MDQDAAAAAPIAKPRKAARRDHPDAESGGREVRSARSKESAAGVRTWSGAMICVRQRNKVEFGKFTYLRQP